MNKYMWWLIKGLIIVLPLALIFFFGRSVIDYADSIWNRVLFQPMWSRDVPLAGFVLTLLFLMLIGVASETRIGRIVHENIMGRIPLVGKIFTSWSPKSQQAIRRVNKFIFAPIWGGYRPARIIAVYPVKHGGHLVQLWFPMIPPATQTYPDTTIIYALAKEGGYDGFSTEIGLRVEFSGGTTVPENAFLNMGPVTLRDFMQSQGLINGSDTHPVK